MTAQADQRTVAGGVVEPGADAEAEAGAKAEFEREAELEIDADGCAGGGDAPFRYTWIPENKPRATA